MNKRVTKHITVSKNLNTQIKYMAKKLDISESAYIRLAVIKDLKERNDN